MLDRLYTSLIHPKRIGMYLSDKWIKIILYVLLLTLVTSIPAILTIASYSKLSTDSVRLLEESIEENRDNIPNVVISDYKLYGVESGYFYVDNFRVSINEEDYNGVAIRLEDDRATLSFMGTDSVSYTYEELNLKDIRFYDLKKGDSQDLTVLVKAINTVIGKTKWAWAPVQIIYNFGYNLISYIVMCLILALIFKLFSMLPYLAILKLVVYANSITQLLILFSNLYYVGLLYYISSIVGTVYSLLAIRSIVIKTVIKR